MNHILYNLNIGIIYIFELISLVNELEFNPIIHKLTIKNSFRLIDTIPKDELVLNLCDGCDIDGLPGPSIGKIKMN